MSDADVTMTPKANVVNTGINSTPYESQPGPIEAETHIQGATAQVAKTNTQGATAQVAKTNTQGVTAQVAKIHTQGAAAQAAIFINENRNEYNPYEKESARRHTDDHHYKELDLYLNHWQVTDIELRNTNLFGVSI